MGDWDLDEGFTTTEDKGDRNKGIVTGGLNAGMTVACLLAVAAVSFGIAWLMKDHVRNFWEMGLTFAAPFAALMASALLVEKVTSRMTPTCSGKHRHYFHWQRWSLHLQSAAWRKCCISRS